MPAPIDQPVFALTPLLRAGAVKSRFLKRLTLLLHGFDIAWRQAPRLADAVQEFSVDKAFCACSPLPSADIRVSGDVAEWSKALPC
ncbi:hypothetical protein [Leisingera methylohalidivorans]|uniref:hypothetical protein n=1 Tax=Leisingera methylohalidivorans TaxID=133924 RepID=UPI000A032FC8|nr:hypothetical protein [Leisingera methylohalidivorans]